MSRAVTLDDIADLPGVQVQHASLAPPASGWRTLLVVTVDRERFSQEDEYYARKGLRDLDLPCDVVVLPRGMELSVVQVPEPVRVDVNAETFDAARLLADLRNNRNGVRAALLRAMENGT
jgi:hypothetical protein